jgi:hypothetical protein
MGSDQVSKWMNDKGTMILMNVSSCDPKFATRRVFWTASFGEWREINRRKHSEEEKSYSAHELVGR